MGCDCTAGQEFLVKERRDRRSVHGIMAADCEEHSNPSLSLKRLHRESRNWRLCFSYDQAQELFPEDVRWRNFEDGLCLTVVLEK